MDPNFAFCCSNAVRILPAPDAMAQAFVARNPSPSCPAGKSIARMKKE
jgi:hypothetical protein